MDDVERINEEMRNGEKRSEEMRGRGEKRNERGLMRRRRDKEEEREVRKD